MSRLLEDILKETQTTQSPCRIREITESLPEEDRAAFIGAINNESINSPAIERALKKNGYSIGSSTIRRHRRGECSCDKPC